MSHTCIQTYIWTLHVILQIHNFLGVASVYIPFNLAYNTPATLLRDQSGGVLMSMTTTGLCLSFCLSVFHFLGNGISNYMIINVWEQTAGKKIGNILYCTVLLFLAPSIYVAHLVISVLPNILLTWSEFLKFLWPF